jgi:hypothetical protein
MDREGVYRMQPQYIQNKRFTDDPRCRPDERGWVQPFAVWQGWDELNRADYALRCLLIWRRMNLPPPQPPYDADGKLNRDELHRGSTLMRIDGDLRNFRFHISRSSLCDRPTLP